ncbi:MAG: VWA domain-containing protein [Deltaproteobacteria bacterium]|nr:VWA domain-containing protein [Deltaproteobacteria bacterium]MBN2670738.1 VWA domain-containing protein [Deltaproteobacteria bacterium]
MRDANTRFLWALLCAGIWLVTTAAMAGDDDDDSSADPLGGMESLDLRVSPKMKMRMPVPSALMAEMDMGVTPGGAQDISVFRDQVASGSVPHPNTLTPEGLFSEHDLPIDDVICRQTICVSGQTTTANILVQPEVKYLAQLGFSSNLNAATWKRAPLNLVAVVDTSGSMGGEPLMTVRASLMQVAAQLGKDDRLSIVRYADGVQVVLQPTAGNHTAAIRKGIEQLYSSGSTYMEEGLKKGFEVAQQSAKSFAGSTRVMLFTDERPNVGATDAGSFMGMARANSRKGIGMTTIGVGVHFGAELATKISSVRGGNLFFFPSVDEMKKVFTEELDTMVTEMAYNMKLVVAPTRGMKIAGVYGVPGELLIWGKNGEIELEVETLFLSTKKGAIYVAFESDSRLGLPRNSATPGNDIGRVQVTYTGTDQKKYQSQVVFRLAKPSAISSGLSRGLLLVNQITSIRKAASLHHEKNDQAAAYRVIKNLASLFRYNTDEELSNEKELVFALENTLAKMSGHHGEPAHNHTNPVTGLPAN